MLGLVLCIFYYVSWAGKNCNLFDYHGDSVNTLVFEDFKAHSSDVEGDLFVGRNLSVQDYSVGLLLPKLNGAKDHLVVGNSFSMVGEVYYGNIVLLNADAPSTCAIGTGSGTCPLFNLNHCRNCFVVNNSSRYDFLGSQQHFEALSSYFASSFLPNQYHVGQTRFTRGAIYLFPFNYEAVERSGIIYVEKKMKIFQSEASHVDVYQIDCSRVAGKNEILVYGCRQAELILINWMGTNCLSSFVGRWSYHADTRHESGQNKETKEFAQKIIHNYPTAEKLSISQDYYGSFLAPFADIETGTGTIWGQTIAKTLNGPIQQNRWPLKACADLPFERPTPSPTNSPTWPAHMFVPSLSRNVPWYLRYTNAPTSPSWECVDKRSAEVYVPGSAGKTILSYCLGFGGHCEPAYGNY